MRSPLPWLSAALIACLLWAAAEHRATLRERARTEAERRAAAGLEVRLAAAEKARLSGEARWRGQTGQDIRRIFAESPTPPDSAAIDRFNAAADRDPVWGPFFRKLERRRVLARDQTLLAALRIPPDKLAPLEELLVERALAGRSTVHRLREAGRKFNSPDVIAAVDHATDAIDAEIEKLIGAEPARELREWNGAIYSYGTTPNGPVAQDAVTLADAGFALRPDQLVRLALIRYEVYVLDPAGPAGAGGNRVDPKSGLTPLEEKLLRRDSEVLAPAEIDVLRDWSREQNRARAAVDALRARFHLETSATPTEQRSE
jgi:hypothetical protein